MVDLQALMDNDTDGVAFVVIRTVECSEASVLAASAGGPLRWTENVYAKSQVLKDVMRTIATCHFQPITSRGNIRPSFRNKITPANLFFFHHLDLLRTHALKHNETAQHIRSLLKYIDQRFGAEFLAADNLFASESVDQEHILYLFKPNDLILSVAYGKPAVFVLQDWPVLSSTGEVTLKCWSFQSDGSGFARRQSTLDIIPIEAKTIKIQDLTAYPLKFATLQIRDLLRKRGQKHWSLRTATQITYKGWNVARDQFFVSPTSIGPWG